jgi:inner membrane protein
MPTVMSHAVAAAALYTGFPKQAIPRKVMLLGIACSMAPDIDVIGPRFGLQPGDLLDHRGITHSIIFAAALASIAFVAVRSSLTPAAKRSLALIYLFLATVSHGLLDAMTDRTGLGIPFFWPLDSTRYFFPFTPIAMSPIGTHFFSERGLAVLLSEFQWVWIPSLVFAVAAISCRHIFRPRSLFDDYPA